MFPSHADQLGEPFWRDTACLGDTFDLLGGIRRRDVRIQPRGGSRQHIRWKHLAGEIGLRLFKNLAILNPSVAGCCE